MEHSYHVNRNSIASRKVTKRKTVTERPLLVAKGFRTNLVQFLPLYHVIVSSVHVCSFTCTIPHVHKRAPKMVLHARNLVYQKL